MRRTVLAAAALLLCGAAAPTPLVLTADGLGPVRIGMTEAAAAKALGVRLDGRPPAAGADKTELEDWRACHSSEAVGMPGVYLMFLDGKLSRVSLAEGARLKTDKGLGVGATEAQVRAAYGKGLKIATHEYIGLPARYLTTWNAATKRGIKYSTDEHRVVQGIDAGDDSIQYTEGCA